jgi:hypothetical protein
MVGVQQVGNLLHHHRKAARVAEVLHQVLAAGLQVHQAGQLTAQALEIVHGQLHADAPGDGDEEDGPVEIEISNEDLSTSDSTAEEDAAKRQADAEKKKQNRVLGDLLKAITNSPGLSPAGL